MNNESVNMVTGTTASPTATATPTLSVKEKWGDVFAGMKKADTLKLPIYNNPLMTQRLGADPYALVYDGRLSPRVEADHFFDFVIPANRLCF